MARLIPGKTKVQIELFKGVTLADIAVGVIAFLAIVFVVISSLPYKVYIVIALLAVAALLLVRMDTQPNYIYLMHILRHFGYGRNYGRSVRDEVLVAGGEEEAQEALLSKLYEEDEEEDPYADETKKERKKRLKEREKQRKLEDKMLKSRKVSEEEKAAIRQRRAEESAAAAARMAEYREANMKRNPVEDIVAFTDIKNGYIEYDGQYFGAVLEIPAVEFRFFSEHRRQNSIENGLGRVLRTLNPNYSANIVKLERPIKYDDYLAREQEKLESLRHSYEQGFITEEELRSRVEIMYERIGEVESLCYDEKVIEPFYYVVLFDSDKRQLENQIDNAVGALRNGEMKPKRLNDKELAVFLKYSNCLDFDERDVEKLSPEEYAQWAMPETVSVKARTVEINRIVTHNMRVVNYPTVVGDAWLAGVFSMPATKCVVKCRPMDRSKAIRTLDRSLQELRGQYMNTSVDSKLIELQTHIETLSNLLAMLQQENEALLEVNIYVTAYDFVATENDPRIVTPEDSYLSRIPNMKKTVRRTYQESGMRLNNMEFDQMQAFIGAQISGWDPMSRQGRGVPSNSLAAAYPWIYATVSDVGGIKLGTSQGVPVFIDFFRRDSERVNSNMVIVGKSGSGKSYATKSLLTNLAAEDSKIFILDPENEYTELAQNLHGKFINVGNAQYGRLNPFHIITALDDDEGDEGAVSGSYATHLQFLEEFFRQILPDCDKDAMEYLNSLVDRMYTNRGITPETDLSGLRASDYPVFDDLYDTILLEFQQTDNEYIRSLLRVLMNYVAKFSSGGRNANIWNGASTVTTDENFTVFNFQSLLANRNSTIANAQMLLVLKYIDNEIIKNRDYNRKYGMKRKVVVVIDEAHVFIDTKFPVALDFMFQLAKRIRKYNGMQIVITQNIKDFVGSEEIARKSTAIINACQYSFIFSLAPNDIGDLCTLYEKAGGINEHEQEQITTAPRGHAFTIMSPTSRSNFHVSVSKEMVEMFRHSNYVSRYFSGEEGAKNWEDFIGSSRAIRSENMKQRRGALEETEEMLADPKKRVTFLEMDEEEFLSEAMQEMKKPAAPQVLFEEIDESFETLLDIPSDAELEKMQTAAPSHQNSKTEETVQVLTDFLSKFSYEAMMDEIRRNVRSELERELGASRAERAMERWDAPAEVVAPATKAEMPVAEPELPVLPAEPEEPAALPAEPEVFVEETEERAPQGSIPFARIPVETIAVPIEEPEEESSYDFSMPAFGADEEASAEDEGAEPAFDIMALLAEQANKMKDISPIDMMEAYDELVIDITLEELTHYVNKMMRGD